MPSPSRWSAGVGRVLRRDSRVYAHRGISVKMLSDHSAARRVARDIKTTLDF